MALSHQSLSSRTRRGDGFFALHLTVRLMPHRVSKFGPATLEPSSDELPPEGSNTQQFVGFAGWYLLHMTIG